MQTQTTEAENELASLVTRRRELSSRREVAIRRYYELLKSSTEPDPTELSIVLDEAAPDLTYETWNRDRQKVTRRIAAQLAAERLPGYRRRTRRGGGGVRPHQSRATCC